MIDIAINDLYTMIFRNIVDSEIRALQPTGIPAEKISIGMIPTPPNLFWFGR
jgi:hypothetical protein